MDHSSKRKLSDIINGGADSLRAAWNNTAAADDFKPLPAGTYTARIIGGELSAARTGTPGYKLAFKVLEGEYVGRQFWHDVWLTPPALPMAKRDLGKLGVTSIEQLDQPLPVGIRVKAKVTLRKEDDGTEHNRVRSFEVLGIDPVTDGDFPPAPSPAADGSTPPKQPLTATGTLEPDESPDVPECDIDPAAKAALSAGGDLFPPTGPKVSVGHD